MNKKNEKMKKQTIYDFVVKTIHCTISLLHSNCISFPPTEYLIFKKFQNQNGK